MCTFIKLPAFQLIRLIKAQDNFAHLANLLIVNSTNFTWQPPQNQVQPWNQEHFPAAQNPPKLYFKPLAVTQIPPSHN